MNVLEANGTSIAWEQAGSEGSPVLLVMGMGARRLAWSEQIEALAAEHRVVWFDNRGMGDSGPVGPALSIPLMAEDALALLDHLGWEAAHVVGISMGGMISQELALLAPERLLSLTLIATHSGRGFRSLPTMAGLAKWLERAVAQGLGKEAWMHSTLVDLIYPKAYQEERGIDALKERLDVAFGGPESAAVVRRQARAVLGHKAGERLRSLEGLPTLVIKTGRDVLVDPSESDWLGDLIPEARVLDFPDAGHGVIGQYAPAINEALLGHFHTADGAGGDP